MKKKDFAHYQPIEVDLGCGKDKIRGAIGIDINPDSDADIILDIEKEPIPLKNHSVDRVWAKQFIEHFENPIPILKEVCRILRDRGEIVIEVPHYSYYVSHGLGHRHYYSYHEVVRMLTRDCGMEIVKAEITFYKTFRMFGIKWLANKSPENYERFWAYLFPAENIKAIARIRKGAA